MFSVFLLEVSARAYAWRKGISDIDKDNFRVTFVMIFDSVVAARMTFF